VSPEQAGAPREIVLGPFDVAVDPVRLADFVAAVGGAKGVPAAFPIVWLSEPVMKEALRAAVGPGRLPVHESQSFDYSEPLSAGRRYRLEAVARHESNPDRLVVESRITTLVGRLALAMRSVLRLVDLGERTG
jgi:hypothetical protein